MQELVESLRPYIPKHNTAQRFIHASYDPPIRLNNRAQEGIRIATFVLAFLLQLKSQGYRFSDDPAVKICNEKNYCHFTNSVLLTRALLLIASFFLIGYFALGRLSTLPNFFNGYKKMNDPNYKPDITYKDLYIALMNKHEVETNDYPPVLKPYLNEAINTAPEYNEINEILINLDKQFALAKSSNSSSITILFPKSASTRSH